MSEWEDELEDEGPQDVDLEELGDESSSETLPCPSCGAEVHEDSVRCPACGDYIAPRTAPASRTWWWILAALAAAAALLYIAMGPAGWF